MALKINLLPPEAAISGPLGQAIKIARMLNVIFLGIFIVFAFGLGVFFITSKLQLQNLTTALNQTKAQITAQESSEQQMVLLKDRLSKIQVVRNIPTATKNITTINPFIEGLSGGSILTELDVDSKKSDVSVLFKTNSDLAAFIKSMSTNTVFKTVMLSSFGFNPASGYLVSVHIL